MLQKKFTVDFLTKTQKVNEGEVPQYFVEGSHPAIISPDTYELVQSEIARRAALGKQLTSSGSPFTGKIICGTAGLFMARGFGATTRVARKLSGNAKTATAAPDTLRLIWPKRKFRGLSSALVMNCWAIKPAIFRRWRLYAPN